MIYQFVCEKCGSVRNMESKPFHPPTPPMHCERPCRRLYNAQIDTSGCQDADVIPREHMQCPKPEGISEREAKARERRYVQSRDIKRRQIAESGKKSGFRQTHAIPPELHAGKIKQTGDLYYWRDKKNVSRHRNWRTDTYGRTRRGRDG